MSLKSSYLSGVKLFAVHYVWVQNNNTNMIFKAHPNPHIYYYLCSKPRQFSVLAWGSILSSPSLSLVKLHSSSDDGAWVRSFSHLFWSRGRQQDGFFMTPQNKKKPKQHHIWLSFFSHLNSKEGVNHASLISSIFWVDSRWLLSEQLHFRGGQKFDTRNLF